MENTFVLVSEVSGLPVSDRNFSSFDEALLEAFQVAYQLGLNVAIRQFGSPDSENLGVVEG